MFNSCGKATTKNPHLLPRWIENPTRCVYRYPLEQHCVWSYRRTKNLRRLIVAQDFWTCLWIFFTKTRSYSSSPKSSDAREKLQYQQLLVPFLFRKPMHWTIYKTKELRSRSFLNRCQQPWNSCLKNIWPRTYLNQYRRRGATSKWSQQAKRDAYLGNASIFLKQLTRGPVTLYSNRCFSLWIYISQHGESRQLNYLIVIVLEIWALLSTSFEQTHWKSETKNFGEPRLVIVGGNMKLNGKS